MSMAIKHDLSEICRWSIVECTVLTYRTPAHDKNIHALEFKGDAAHDDISSIRQNQDADTCSWWKIIAIC